MERMEGVVVLRPLAPDRTAREMGAQVLHFLVILLLLSKQPGDRHCRTVLHLAIVPPHQLQKLMVVLSCVLPSGPPHLQMQLSTDGAVVGAGAGADVSGAKCGSSSTMTCCRLLDEDEAAAIALGG